jgi:hypothetical protein
MAMPDCLRHITRSLVEKLVDCVIDSRAGRGRDGGFTDDGETWSRF